MATLFLAMIYSAFVSLGLPDSMLGAAWPEMVAGFAVPVESAGTAAMVTSLCTVISSLFTNRLVARFGTGRTTLFSVMLTAAALTGIALAPSFLWLCVLAVPLGLGAGAVDAALNNFVALHYAARHMSWLHCCWGLGATLGPVILSVFLGGHNGWRFGYGAVAALQWCLVLALAATLRLWGRYEPRQPGEPGQARAGTQLSLISTARQTGVWAAMLSYFCYCAVENTTLLWGASYFVSARGFSTVAAAQAASVFVLGITAGRFLCGFASARLSSSALILGGGALAALGAAGMALLPASLGPAALCVVGLGFAPAYPCMMHGRHQPADGGSLCGQCMHAATVRPGGGAGGHVAAAGVFAVRCCGLRRLHGVFGPLGAHPPRGAAVTAAVETGQRAFGRVVLGKQRGTASVVPQKISCFTSRFPGRLFIYRGCSGAPLYPAQAPLGTGRSGWASTGRMPLA